MANNDTNAVLCGFDVIEEGKKRRVKEFSRAVAVEYEAGNPRPRTLEVKGRVYEYTGDDADGRRVYRDHTRY